jgi:hypothetical protein
MSWWLTTKTPSRQGHQEYFSLCLRVFVVENIFPRDPRSKLESK